MSTYYEVGGGRKRKEEDKGGIMSQISLVMFNGTAVWWVW